MGSRAFSGVSRMPGNEHWTLRILDNNATPDTAKGLFRAIQVMAPVRSLGHLRTFTSWRILDKSPVGMYIRRRHRYEVRTMMWTLIEGRCADQFPLLETSSRGRPYDELSALIIFSVGAYSPTLSKLVKPVRNMLTSRWKMEEEQLLVPSNAYT